LTNERDITYHFFRRDQSMKEAADTKNIGLRGIKVADTRISDVNGEKGILIYRGYNIVDLARSSTYEEVSFLLLNDHLPGRKELEKYRADLIAERGVPEAVIELMKRMPKLTHPMDVLQAAVPFLASFDPHLHMETREANLKKAVRLIAKLPNVVSAWDRIRNGLEPVSPHPDLSHAGNFLYMLKGALPDPETAKDFDICLILHAEHSFNASTFAGREVASTHAHMYASVAAALGALSGELHGGANSEVMKMLLEIGEVNRVKAWVSDKLGKGGKIMGMGHAVYRTEDPRATVLRSICDRMVNRYSDRRWFDISKAVEAATKEEFKKMKGKEIYPNVDFYSASVYYMMGIPRDLFTPVFAISRMSGLTAHIIEEKLAEAQPRAELYRPDADYVGTYCGPEACEFVPLDERKS
jgi:citrate synthase